MSEYHSSRTREPITDDEQTFLQAATANPTDDALRLLYANWLDRQGEEAFATQAEFVRLQVRRSRRDVFDPDRDGLLDAETALLRKYGRDWNGRIHRRLRQLGLPAKVDARGELIRGWDYHRGMITRVAVVADGLAAHPELVFSLGPVQSLKLFGWQAQGWDLDPLHEFIPRLNALSLARPQVNVTLPQLRRLDGFGCVPLLDLRSVDLTFRSDHLLRLAQDRWISPVVLFRRTIWTKPYVRATNGRRHRLTFSYQVHSVIDPFGLWDSLRLWYADLIGEVLTPIPYPET